MIRWRRLAHVWLVLALLAGVLGAGAGGAGAADSPPAGSVRAARAVHAAGNAPSLGSVPAIPPGCATGSLQGVIVVNKPIPDATGPTTPGVLTSTATAFLPNPSVYVWDVNVAVNITHTFSGDLDIFLISPHGTRVTLAHHNGTSLDDIYRGATFDDQAGLTHPPGPVTMANFQNNIGVGLVNPQEPLSAFNGENPNGTWTLEVRDIVPAGTGVLQNWSLQITALSSVPATLPVRSSVSNAMTPIPDGSGPVDIPLDHIDTLAPLSALTLTTVITHPAAHDLVIELISPTGITLTVSNRNPFTTTPAIANVFAGTTWTDKAGAANPPGPVTDNDYISGTVETPLSPQEGFAELNGTTQSGAWHLIVRDIITGTSGTLGRVSLSAAALSCRPYLSPGIGGAPNFPRLGKALVLTALVANLGAPASDVIVKTRVGGPYAFQSAAGPGWSCATPGLGTLSPNVDCVRSTLAQTSTRVNVTVTAPLVPRPTLVTVSVSSSDTNLNPNPSITSETTAFAQSANGNPWDVMDQLNTDFGFPPDSGSVRFGGQNSFFGFGQIQVRALDLTGTLLGAATPQHLRLAYSPGHRWRGLATAFVGGIGVRRDILAPAGYDWLRYVDHFTNNNGAPARVVVSWGGLLRSDSQTKIAATSSGNLTLAQDDTWAVTFQQTQPNGPAVKPPIGLAFRSTGDSSYQGPYLFTGNPFTTTVWPSLGNGNLGQVFSFVVPPGETRALAYFVARGLAEGTPGPADCDFYGGCVTPPAGSQVALIESTVANLAANPFFCDLSLAERAEIINWPGISTTCMYLPVLQR
jgi:subtilisin-like proprotein convertase family protein